MEEKNPHIVHRHAMTYGAYAAIALCAISFALYLMNAFFSNQFTILNYLVICIFIYLGVTRYRDLYNHGVITYGKALQMGTYIIFWASVIVGFYSYLMYKYVDPSLFEQFLSRLSDGLRNSQMSDEQVELTINFYHMMLSPFIIGISQLIGITLLGFVFSLIISFAVRRPAITGSADSNPE